MRETEIVFREWMHLFREWMRLFRECMRLFRGSKSAHQLSVHVRWESKDTPLGTNNQSQQPYHRLFDLKKRPRLGQNVPWIQVEPARDCLWRHSTWWYSCRLYAISRFTKRPISISGRLHFDLQYEVKRNGFAIARADGSFWQTAERQHFIPWPLPKISKTKHLLTYCDVIDARAICQQLWRYSDWLFPSLSESPPVIG